MYSMYIDVKDYDLVKTVTCGQFFRYKEVGTKQYVLYAGSNMCVVSQLDVSTLGLTMACPENEIYWRYILGIDIDNSGVIDVVLGNHKLCQACRFSQGLHLMRQEPWESLVSYIISQRNNIPRIQQCIEKLCYIAGTPNKSIASLPGVEDVYYTFPTPEQILAINLDSVGLGYRQSYVLRAAEAVLSGDLDLELLMVGRSTSKRAIQDLTRVSGVGIKVANCVGLFGLGHTDLFPVDVWIERAMTELDISVEDIVRFGKYAGVIQEYIYYYMREYSKG